MGPEGSPYTPIRTLRKCYNIVHSTRLIKNQNVNTQYLGSYPPFWIFTKLAAMKKEICFYYTIIDFNEVDVRIYLPKKVIFTEVTKPRWKSFIMVDKSSCLPKLKSITVLLYDFLTMNKNVLLSRFCCWSHVQPKDFLTNFSNCY